MYTVVLQNDMTRDKVPEDPASTTWQDFPGSLTAVHDFVVESFSQ